jgi:hypothetical protein
VSLPDAAALKRALKIEHTAEDTLVAELLARAIGLVQGYIGTPITAAEVVFVDEADYTMATKVGVKTLLIPKTPVDPESVAITDAQDTALDLADLRVDGETGTVRYRDGSRFANGPYEITCAVGLSAHRRYAVEFEPIVSAAIVDTVSDLYARRNPSQQSEGVGGGRSTAFALDGLPKRVQDSLDRIRQEL